MPGDNDKGKGSKGEDIPSSIAMNQHVKEQDQDDKCAGCDDGENKGDLSSEDPLDPSSDDTPVPPYMDWGKDHTWSDTGFQSHDSTSLSERAKKVQLEASETMAELRFAVTSESRTGKKERKFEIKCVSEKGKLPRCNLCSVVMEKGRSR